MYENHRLQDSSRNTTHFDSDNDNRIGRYGVHHPRMTNSHFQEETNRNDHIAPMYDVTAGFKQLRNIWSYISQSVRTILSRMSFNKHKAMHQLKRLTRDGIESRSRVALIQLLLFVHRR